MQPAARERAAPRGASVQPRGAVSGLRCFGLTETYIPFFRLMSYGRPCDRHSQVTKWGCHDSQDRWDARMSIKIRKVEDLKATCPILGTVVNGCDS